MKIKDKRKTRRSCFRDIDTGECFFSGDGLYTKTGDGLYMKIPNIRLEGGIPVNAIEVVSGRHAEFGGGAPIQPVSAKVVIE